MSLMSVRWTSVITGRKTVQGVNPEPNAADDSKDRGRSPDLFFPAKNFQLKPTMPLSLALKQPCRQATIDDMRSARHV
jgi:hypothetical protein